MDYTGSINFYKLMGVKPVKVEGEQGIFIPLAQNPAMWASEKGVFMGIKVKESPNNKYGDTHFIAANVINAGVRTQLGDNLRQAEPIMGNLRPFGKKSAEITEHSEEQGKSDLPF